MGLFFCSSVEDAFSFTGNAKGYHRVVSTYQWDTDVYLKVAFSLTVIFFVLLAGNIKNSKETAGAYRLTVDFV